MSGLLKTTIAGSLPKPAWLAETLKLWPKWRLEGSALLQAQYDATSLAIREQELAGIDIVTDGEQARQHFVTSFIEGLEGVDAVNKKPARLRDRYVALVPVVKGPLFRRKPVFVDIARFARSQTARRLKFTLPGPLTIIDSLLDEFYHDRERLAYEFAAILNEEAREIAALGVDVIQFDEPAFNVGKLFDDVVSWGVKALDRAASGLPCKTAVHVCYGYGIQANIEWKRSLGTEWRQYEQLFPLIEESSLAQVSLECRNSKVPVELIGILTTKELLIGAIDVATEDVETPEDVAATLRSALKYASPERVFPCTNCGMAPLSREAAYAKLRALSAGAELVRNELEGK